MLKSNVVLFLCTGNYYRSRFAEELFNHRAGLLNFSWTARSRALAVERLSKHNSEQMSRIAVTGLRNRGCMIRGADRAPQQSTAEDLRSADHIVALDRFEHRSLLRERFAGWEDRVEYWEVGDLGVLPPDIALAEIEARVDALIRRLPSQKQKLHSERS